jgi:hypothetical protein
MTDAMPPRTAPDPLAGPWAPLLDALAAGDASALAVAQPPVRRDPASLFARVARSAAAAERMHTTRLSDAPASTPRAGVTQRALYRACTSATGAAGSGLRPGEPLAADVIELTAGTRVELPPAEAQTEWLLLDGDARFDDSELPRLGYHVVPGRSTTTLHTREGARLYRRTAPRAADAGVVPAREWLPYGPGIERLLLWQRGPEAAMLYRTEPGAQVPLHGHGHDEECLMVSGDLFLDDVLLREGDYQLAPAGSEHTSTDTDTGCILFAHGDIELQLR